MQLKGEAQRIGAAIRTRGIALVPPLILLIHHAAPASAQDAPPNGPCAAVAKSDNGSGRRNPTATTTSDDIVNRAIASSSRARRSDYKLISTKVVDFHALKTHAKARPRTPRRTTGSAAGVTDLGERAKPLQEPTPQPASASTSTGDDGTFDCRATSLAPGILTSAVVASGQVSAARISACSPPVVDTECAATTDRILDPTAAGGFANFPELTIDLVDATPMKPTAAKPAEGTGHDAKACPQSTALVAGSTATLIPDAGSAAPHEPPSDAVTARELAGGSSVTECINGRAIADAETGAGVADGRHLSAGVHAILRGSSIDDEVRAPAGVRLDAGVAAALAQTVQSFR
jgi:hypothetical protein